MCVHDNLRPKLPPHYPDTPGVRADFANYYDEIARFDGMFAQVLDELKTRGLKLAPFDGFKRQQYERPAVAPPVVEGIACVAAVRAAVGADVQIMVDAHSLFDVPLALEVAARLERK